MREMARQTIRCFARGCPVQLFTDFGVPMDSVLKSIEAGRWQGPSPEDQPRFWYAADVNRCYCLDHGMQYAMLAKALPLALQELSALASLYPDYRTRLSDLDPAYQNVRRAEDRVAHLREVESMLLPLAEELGTAGPKDNDTTANPANLHVHAGRCLQCYDDVSAYREEFRRLAAGESLSAELLTRMRERLCDVGKTAFDRLLSEQQGTAIPRQP